MKFQAFDSEFAGRKIPMAALLVDGIFDDITEGLKYQLDTGAPVSHIFQGVFPEMTEASEHRVQPNLSLTVRPMPGVGVPYDPSTTNVAGILGLDFLFSRTGSFGFDFAKRKIVWDFSSDTWGEYRIVGGHIYLKDVEVDGTTIPFTLYDSGCSLVTVALHHDGEPEAYEEKLTLPGAFGEMSDLYLRAKPSVIRLAGTKITFGEIAYSKNELDGMKVAILGNRALDGKILFFRRDGKFALAVSFRQASVTEDFFGSGVLGAGQPWVEAARATL